MNIGSAALVFGIVFVLGGLAGFVATPPPPDAPPLVLEHGHGIALGLLPVNTLHNIVHLLFGILGIAASRGVIMSARGYFRMVVLLYGPLVVLGLIPATQTVFGLIPIWGNDVWFHLLLTVGAAYFAFLAPATARARV